MDENVVSDRRQTVPTIVISECNEQTRKNSVPSIPVRSILRKRSYVYRAPPVETKCVDDYNTGPGLVRGHQQEQTTGLTPLTNSTSNLRMMRYSRCAHVPPQIMSFQDDNLINGNAETKTESHFEKLNDQDADDEKQQGGSCFNKCCRFFRSLTHREEVSHWSILVLVTLHFYIPISR